MIKDASTSCIRTTLTSKHSHCLIGLLALGACETTGIGGTGGSSESRAQRMAENGDHDEAAGAYMGLAVGAVWHANVIATRCSQWSSSWMRAT